VLGRRPSLARSSPEGGDKGRGGRPTVRSGGRSTSNGGGALSQLGFGPLVFCSDGTTDRRGLGGTEQRVNQPALREGQAGKWDGLDAAAIVRPSIGAQAGTTSSEVGDEPRHARVLHHRTIPMTVAGAPRTQRET